MKALLIAGTDTGVGKTVLTSALVAYGQAHMPNKRLGLMKPVQSGVGDRELYTRLFHLDQTPEDITPIYLRAPLAPPIAAFKEQANIDLGLLWQRFEALRRQRDVVLIEALGGLGSPITWQTTVADLAWDWQLPTVLVVPVRLGAIAQAVANVALARQSRLHLKGIVLNCVQLEHDSTASAINDLAPPGLIESLTGVPILGTIPHLSDPTDVHKLIQVASNLEIERLLPL
ncbi:MAG: dethiobiotin synthase [Cyanobacteria bacterium]|nr:dethiobiotin synthase [Cyanobacteriota bacterium]MDW8202019.1 dethiobiotin synthase [Cyanobacteriota bacterium SKYGB_h_bin112]